MWTDQFFDRSFCRVLGLDFCHLTTKTQESQTPLGGNQRTGKIIFLCEPVFQRNHDWILSVTQVSVMSESVPKDWLAGGSFPYVDGMSRRMKEEKGNATSDMYM